MLQEQLQMTSFQFLISNWNITLAYKVGSDLLMSKTITFHKSQTQLTLAEMQRSI